MAHRYGHIITVTRRPGQPVAFVWRGLEYDVQPIAHWNVQDRWWDATHHTESWQWRVMKAVFQTFDLYCENGVRRVLDVVHDY